MQKYPDKRAPFQEISLSLLCIVRCTYTDILKRSAISLYSVDVKLDTLLRNIGIIRKGALLGCICTRVPLCLVRAWCIRILHTSKRGCQFILSILQEVQAYIEDKTGFGSPALFVCLNFNNLLTALAGLQGAQKEIIMDTLKVKAIKVLYELCEKKDPLSVDLLENIIDAIRDCYCKVDVEKLRCGEKDKAFVGTENEKFLYDELSSFIRGIRDIDEMNKAKAHSF